MATRQLSSFANGQVLLEVDYNAGTLAIDVVRCINSTSEPVRFRLKDPEIFDIDITFSSGTSEITVSGQLIDDGEVTLGMPYETRIEYPWL